ncbi:hypothetical protein ACLBOM_14785 [Escherichia coli]
MFIVVAIFNSFHLLPQSGEHAGNAGYLPAGNGDGGAGSGPLHASARCKKAGAKPLLMALVLFAWLIVGGGAISYLIKAWWLNHYILLL